jgi:hypothetical protein
MPYKKKRSQLSGPSRLLAILGGLVVAVIAATVVLELTNTTHLFHAGSPVKKSVIPTTSTSSSAGSSKAATNKVASSTPVTSSGSSGSSGTSSKDTGPSSSSGTSSSGSGPIMPYGDFIANHRPSLSASQGEASVCFTTPGATCAITFTNGNLVNTLPTQTTGSDGSTSWGWTVNQQSGFTVGHWGVTVTATLNGKTATATDSMDVQP